MPKKKKETTILINQQVCSNRKGVRKKQALKYHPYGDKSNNKKLGIGLPEQVRAHYTQSDIWVHRSWLKSRAGWLVPVLGKAANHRE